MSIVSQIKPRISSIMKWYSLFLNPGKELIKNLQIRPRTTSDFRNFHKMTLIIIPLTLSLLLMVSSCGVKLELPTASNDNPVFGAGDTSYIRVSPDWDASNGYDFSKPWDIIVGADGYVFVADHNEPSIHVISASGSEIIADAYGNDFSALAYLVDNYASPVYPAAIAQDNRLNLFIADSSNRLLVWNQYLNNVGIDSMATSIQLSATTGDLIWVSDFDSIATLQSEGWVINNIEWSADNLIQWLNPHLFWDAGDSSEAIQVARYFVDPDSVRLTGVSARGDQCLVADAHSNAILGLAYVPAALLMTSLGDEILVYRGTMTERTVSTGTGNGTVNAPKGLAHGPSGALFYTQWGENFSVHKVGGSSGFEYGEHDIMEIERYDHASDISLDAIGNIYVADTGHDKIQQFSSNGKFAFNIGISRVLVDSTITDSALVGSDYEIIQRDTSYQVEVADILRAPRSVAVDGRGIVYIADTQNNRVMRYRLSTELDYGAEN